MFFENFKKRDITVNNTYSFILNSLILERGRGSQNFERKKNFPKVKTEYPNRYFKKSVSNSNGNMISQPSVSGRKCLLNP
jgi:hypothetical protein